MDIKEQKQDNFTKSNIISLKNSSKIKDSKLDKLFKPATKSRFIKFFNIKENYNNKYFVKPNNNFIEEQLNNNFYNSDSSCLINALNKELFKLLCNK